MRKKLTEDNCDEFSYMAYCRHMLGLSQSELACRVGCSRNTISAIENGSDCSLSLAFKIADELVEDVHRLFNHPVPWDDWY